MKSIDQMKGGYKPKIPAKDFCHVQIDITKSSETI